MPDEHPTEPEDDPPQRDDAADDAGEQERTDEGMAPLVTNTGDDDDGAPTG